MRFTIIGEIVEVQSIATYRVIPDPDAAQDGDLRAIDESGEDYLYPGDYFVIVDFPASAIRALRKSFAREASEAR